jgi:hypothetical protein
VPSIPLSEKIISSQGRGRDHVPRAHADDIESIRLPLSDEISGSSEEEIAPVTTRRRSKEHGRQPLTETQGRSSDGVEKAKAVTGWGYEDVSILNGLYLYANAKAEGEEPVSVDEFDGRAGVVPSVSTSPETAGDEVAVESADQNFSTRKRPKPVSTGWY